jgi:hypothetical protein
MNQLYTKCYCEENIYRLASFLNIPKSFVCFISNSHKTVPFWCQKSQQHPSVPVVWDYHVILLEKQGRECNIYDFDTTLSFPCRAKEYLSKSLLINQIKLDPTYQRKYRIIESEVYLKHFASDRSHMKTETGWLAEPPRQQLIQTAESKMNLHSYIDMTQDHDVQFGKVYTEEEFVSFTNI